MPAVHKNYDPMPGISEGSNVNPFSLIMKPKLLGKENVLPMGTQGS